MHRLMLVKGRSPGLLSQTLRLDPVFDADNSGERKQGEKIHGKRQR
jgi:hypothetical protein